MSRSAVVDLLRIAWRTVGSIVTRVSADIEATVDRLEGLRRIGIDEISYKRHHRYLTVVVDHDTGRLVWAAAGRDEATLGRFFDDLGPERAAALTHVSADMADWIARVVDRRAPNAIRCGDPFHIVAWALDALDVERRRAWNQAKGRRHTDQAGRQNRSLGPSRELKRSRFALWKNPENLTRNQFDQLLWIAATDPRLWRAYRLKEALRQAFKIKGEAGKESLEEWINWARDSAMPSFVRLSERIERHRDAIHATFDSGLSNGLVESTNTKIRLLTRVAYGFHGPKPLIALAMLSLGAHPPTLPGRT